MDDFGTACQSVTNEINGLTLNFVHFCQDLNAEGSPSTDTSSTGSGECVCPWNSDLVKESD